MAKRKEYFMKSANFYIYSGKLKSDLTFGLLFGIGFVILNLLAPSITIGFPTLPQATGGERTSVAGILAPSGEEFAFRGLLLSAFDMVFPVWLAVPAQAAVFALYHAKAYGASLALQNISSISGALVGAGLFGIVAGILTIWKKSLIPAMVTHAIFNLYLVGKYLVVVSL